MCGSSLTRLLEKPTSKIKVLVIKAAPTEVKVRFKAASISSSTSSSRRNLLTKWIVSSTAIPMMMGAVIKVVVSSLYPIQPIRPKTVSIGKELGRIAMIPSFSDPNTKIKIREMNSNKPLNVGYKLFKIYA